ncbi:MAG: phage tail protein [Sedimenticola sp.]|nr:MAG: phage tail protein [Sedimenticola sp.]
MSEPFLAEIVMFGSNFAPRSWAFCDGQLLAINSNQALFSLLGTIYGGDGQTTFALPDLRGRVPVGPRQGPGLSNYTLGQKGGTESVTLTANQIPAHRGSTLDGDSTDPTGRYPAAPNVAGRPANAYRADNNTNMGTGGGQSHTNVQPYLAINFIIALQGVFPSRN